MKRIISCPDGPQSFSTVVAGKIRTVCFTTTPGTESTDTEANGHINDKVAGLSIERNDGNIEQLAYCAEAIMQAGDIFVIETPGGGGFGPAD